MSASKQKTLIITDLAYVAGTIIHLLSQKYCDKPIQLHHEWQLLNIVLKQFRASTKQQSPLYDDNPLLLYNWHTVIDEHINRKYRIVFVCSASTKTPFSERRTIG